MPSVEAHHHSVSPDAERIQEEGGKKVCLQFDAYWPRVICLVLYDAETIEPPHFQQLNTSQFIFLRFQIRFNNIYYQFNKRKAFYKER